MADSILTPQQAEFLANYTNPNSETFGNALQSALKAKYSQEYSESITAKGLDWLAEYVGDAKLVNKALRNLDKALDGELDDQEKTGRPLQLKATELALKGLQKSKWSDRVEHTGKNGGAIQVEGIEISIRK